MAPWIRSVILILMLVLGSGGLAVIAPAAAAAQEVDEEVPPGNPVIGSDRPGDVEAESDTQYALWGLVAICLIAAGTLLVKVEQWEANRRTNPP